MVLEFETNLIVDEGIRKGTRELLDMFAEKIKEQPTSLSGKHHLRDFFVELHLQRATWFANELCREFNIQGRDRDIILSATLLHDIGNYEMSRKGNVEGVVEYYEATGWGRIAPLDQHPLIGKDIILKSTLPSKELIADLIVSHMSAWYQNCPQPKTLPAYIVCISDYFASREPIIVEGVDK